MTTDRSCFTCKHKGVCRSGMHTDCIDHSPDANTLKHGPPEAPSAAPAPKTRYSYPIWHALAATFRVLTLAGAAKYLGPFRALEQPPEEHFDALMRHITEHARGITADAETGQHPLAHAAARCLILLEIELRRNR